MFRSIKDFKKCASFKIIASTLIVSYLFTYIIEPPSAQARMVPVSSGLSLPATGTMVPLTPAFTPLHISGLTVYPENPLSLDFIMGQGDAAFQTKDDYHEEAHKLVKYFLTSLTVPENDLWVNLSPYEQDRIIPESFIQTDMGRDTLAQDYILKQLTASLMYPEKDLGKKLWTKIHARMEEKFPGQDFPVHTFNKIWIVPDKAVVFQKANNVFVVESRLKVMLDQDYISQQKNAEKHGFKNTVLTNNSPNEDEGFAEIVRNVMIPEIEREVNHGKNFAPIRQIYHALILADWYKTNLRESLLGQVYVDRKKTRGIEIDDPAVKEKIYRQYIESFRKGVFNFVKEDYDPASQQIIPRKYVSGGVELALKVDPEIIKDEALLTSEQRNALTRQKKTNKLAVRLLEWTKKNAAKTGALARRAAADGRERLAGSFSRAGRFLARIPKDYLVAGLALGALAATEFLLSSQGYASGTEVHKAGFLGFFSLGGFWQAGHPSYARKQITVKANGWKELGRKAAVSFTVLGFAIYFAMHHKDLFPAKTPPLKQKIIAETSYERLQSLQKTTIEMPDGSLRALTQKEKIALETAFQRWAPWLQQQQALMDLHRHPDRNVRAQALDFLRTRPGLIPEPLTFEHIIEQTGEEPRVSESAARLLGRATDNFINQSDTSSQISPAEQLTPAQKKLLNILDRHENLDQKNPEIHPQSFLDSRLIDDVYVLSRQDPAFRSEIRAATVKAGFEEDFLSLLDDLPPEFIHLGVVIIFTLLLGQFEKRIRTSIEDFSKTYRILFDVLSKITFASLGFMAAMYTHGGAQHIINDPQPIYYRMEEGKLKPPADERVITRDIVHTLKTETPHYNAAAGILINSVAQNGADSHPQSFRILSELFDHRTNDITDADLNSIYKFILSQPISRQRFQKFVEHDAERIQALIGHPVSAELGGVQQLELPTKTALIKEFVAYLIHTDKDQYDPALYRAAMQTLWFMQWNPVGDIEDIRQDPLQTTVLNQFIHSDSFAADKEFSASIRQGLESGEMILIKFPKGGKEYQLQAMREIFKGSDFWYQLPPISRSSSLLAALTGLKVDEVQELKNGRFVIIKTSSIDAVRKYATSLYKKTGTTVMLIPSKGSQLQDWEALWKINLFLTGPNPSVLQDNTEPGQEAGFFNTFLPFFAVGSFSLIPLWWMAKLKKRRYEREQEIIRSGKKAKIEYEGRPGTIIGMIFASSAIVGMLTLWIGNHQQTKLDRSTAPDPAYYETMTPETFLQAASDPLTLDMRRKLMAPYPKIADIHLAGQLGDIRLVPELVKINHLHQDDSVRQAAGDALKEIETRLQSDLESRIEQLRYVMQDPKLQEWQTDRNIQRLQKLVSTLIRRIPAESDLLDDLVALQTQIDPDDLKKTLDEIGGTESEKGKAVIDDLWATVQNNPVPDENSLLHGVKLLLEQNYWGTRFKKPPLERNENIRKLLDESHIADDPDYTSLKDRQNALKNETIRNYVIVLGLIVALLQLKWLRQSNSKKGLLEIVRFNTPGPRRSQFWRQVIDLKETKEEPDVTKTLLETEIVLIKNVESISSEITAAETQRHEIQYGNFTEKTKKSKTAQINARIIKYEHKKTSLEKYISVVKEALTARFEKGTTSTDTFITAWRSLFDEYPGFYDVFQEQALRIQPRDAKDHPLTAMVKRYKKELFSVKDEDTGEKIIDLKSRSGMLKGAIALHALRDIMEHGPIEGLQDVQASAAKEARKILEQFLEFRFPDELKPVEEKDGKDLKKWQVDEEGLERVYFEKLPEDESVGIIENKGGSLASSFARRNKFAVYRIYRYMRAQALLGLGRLTLSDSSRAEADTPDDENDNSAENNRDHMTDTDEALLSSSKRTFLGGLGVAVILTVAGCTSIGKRPGSWYEAPLRINSNHVAAMVDDLRLNLGKDQKTANEITAFTERLKSDPDLIKSEGLESAAFLADAAASGPETARAVNTALVLIRQGLNKTEQKDFDRRILNHLTALVGHPNEQSRTVAQTWLIGNTAADAKDKLLTLVNSSNPYISASAVRILGFRHDQGTLIHIARLAEKSQTTVQREAALDALQFSTGQVRFFTEDDIRTIIEVMRSFGHLPDNAFERIDHAIGVRGSNYGSRKKFWEIGGRGWERGERELDQEWTTTELVETEWFGQTIEEEVEITHEITRSHWTQPDMEVRIELDRGMYLFLIDLIRNPFEDHALNHLIDIATLSNNPQTRIAALQRLARLDQSKKAVATLVHLLQDKDPAVRSYALTALKAVNNHKLLRETLFKQERELSPDIFKQAGDRLLDVFINAWGIYAQRNLMGLYTARDQQTAGIYKGLGTTGNFLQRVHAGDDIFSAAVDTGAEYWLSEQIADFMRTVPPGLKLPIDIFAAEIGIEWRKDQIKKYMSQRDPTNAYRAMAYLFTRAATEKDLSKIQRHQLQTIFLSMLHMKDPILQDLAGQGLKNLNYEYKVKALSERLQDKDLQKSAHAVMLLGKAGTKDAVSILDSFYTKIESYELKKSVISALADIVRNGEAGNAAASVLLRQGRTLLELKGDQPDGLRRHITEQIQHSVRKIRDAYIQAQINQLLEQYGADTRSSAVSQTDNLKTVRALGETIDIEHWQGRAQDLEKISEALREALFSADARSADRQAMWINVLEKIARQNAKDIPAVTELLKTAATRGNIAIRLQALEALGNISPQTFIGIFPPAYYKVSDYAPNALRSIELWQTRRVFLNADGNPVNFDSLVRSAHRSKTVPADLVWAARKGWVLKLQIEAIQALATLPGNQAEQALIQIAQDRDSLVSGYATVALIKRSQTISGSDRIQRLNRIGAALNKALEHDHWAVRWQIIRELQVFLNERITRLSELEKGMTTQTAEDSMDEARAIRSRLRDLWTILHNSLEDRFDPDEEGIPAIRTTAAHVLAGLEQGGGIRPSQRLQRRTEVGQSLFDDPTLDPKYSIDQEIMSEPMRIILTQAFLSAAINNKNILNQAPIEKMLAHQNPDVRIMYIHALYLSGEWDAAAKKKVLASLDEDHRDVLKVKMEALLEKGMNPQIVKRRLIDLSRTHPTAAYGLAQLIDDREIPRDDPEAFFAFLRLLQDRNIETQGQGVRGLQRMNFRNDPGILDKFTREQRESIKSYLKNVNSLSRPITVEGKQRVPEAEMLKALLPFDLVEGQKNQPTFRDFQAGRDYVFTRLGFYPEKDRRAQTHAIQYMNMPDEKHRKMGYEMARDLMRFVPSSVDTLKLVPRLIARAGREADPWARRELFRTLGASGLKTSWNALGTQLSEEDFSNVLKDTITALDQANVDEGVTLIKLTGVSIQENFSGTPNKNATLAELYLAALDSSDRRTRIRKEGLFPTVFARAANHIDLIKKEAASASTPKEKLYWEKMYREYKLRQESIRVENTKEAQKEKYREQRDSRKKTSSDADPALLNDRSSETETVGGIDLYSEGFEVQILRDGSGFPLPTEQQPLPQLRLDIEGFIPVIIHQTPVMIPQLLGLRQDQDKIKSAEKHNSLDIVHEVSCLQLYEKPRHSSYHQKRHPMLLTMNF
ncbi:MAG: HEAT repeat domain-containing protein [Candidatus Omnitrophota bacterium]